jgi:EpsI family protein
MDSKKRSTIVAASMFFTAGAAALLKPSPRQFEATSAFDLQTIVPKEFGVWSHEPTAGLALIDPQAKQLLDKIYSQILSRVYKNTSGYRVMLSIAYGSDQRGALQAHKPEVCYPAQGFSMTSANDGSIQTPLGVLPVRQLRMALGARKEPITYWFTVGEQTVVTAFDRRLATLKSVMTGRIPDGLLFRVSSIDSDSDSAFRKQGDFVVQLLSALPAQARVRLSGL